jgi:hypothetical protein
MISRAVAGSDRRTPTIPARGAPVPPLRDVPHPGSVRGFGCVPGPAPAVAPDGDDARSGLPLPLRGDRSESARAGAPTPPNTLRTAWLRWPGSHHRGAPKGDGQGSVDCTQPDDLPLIRAAANRPGIVPVASPGGGTSNFDPHAHRVYAAHRRAGRAGLNLRLGSRRLQGGAYRRPLRVLPQPLTSNPQQPARALPKLTVEVLPPESLPSTYLLATEHIRIKLD